MKIKLLKDVPVEAKHGLTKGKIFDVIREDEGRNARIWIMGKAGEECAVFKHEVKTIEE